MRPKWNRDLSRGDPTFELAAARLDDQRQRAAQERLVSREATIVPGMRWTIGGWLITLGRAIRTTPVTAGDAFTR